MKTYFVATEKNSGNCPDGHLKTSMVMELCDKGTLKGWREQSWQFADKADSQGYRLILRCLLDVARGMVYLHAMGMVHGDLKCDNLLLQSTKSDVRGFTVKIADLGHSRLKSDLLGVFTTTYGAPFYASPELLEKGELSQVVAFLKIVTFGTAKTVAHFCIFPSNIIHVGSIGCAGKRRLCVCNRRLVSLQPWR